MLYFHRGFDGNDVIDLLKIFTAHKFGHNRFGDKVDTSLVDSIGHLEAVLIVYLLDLPALTETIEDVADLDRHPIWKNSSLVQDLDKNIGSNLGKNIFEIQPAISMQICLFGTLELAMKAIWWRVMNYNIKFTNSIL